MAYSRHVSNLAGSTWKKSPLSIAHLAKMREGQFGRGRRCAIGTNFRFFDLGVMRPRLDRNETDSIEKLAEAALSESKMATLLSLPLRHAICGISGVITELSRQTHNL
jgi:hypothetical protein